MSELKGKIDFVALISATNANPNGDPLNGNRPRESFEGYGEISDVCIKRKIRNRFQDDDIGERIFVQSDDRADDGFDSLHARADGCKEFSDAMKKKDKIQMAKVACKTWADVRMFGQVFAFSDKKKKDNESDSKKESGVSVGVRGPVSIHPAMSVSPVELVSTQITKSVNSESDTKKTKDTMGMKHRVTYGLYVVKGSVNVQLAEKTGFSQEDAENLKHALRTLFENDASSARPEGSMEVERLYWWQHCEKTPAVSTAKIHRSVKIAAKTDRPVCFGDYEVALENPEGCVEPEVY